MPRAYKDNQLVDVFYSSRTTQVKGLGRVETYISKERKYSVRMLSYKNYYVPSHYHRIRTHWQPHDKVLKAWSYELTPCYDTKPHIDEMERTRSDTIQAMYQDVSARVKVLMTSIHLRLIIISVARKMIGKTGVTATATLGCIM